MADVGCDHGYIGLGAMANCLTNKVIFVDISQPSLQKAQDNCQKQGVSNCQFVCQNGLQKVTCDCAVIAGMGGLEIISILQNTQSLPQWLVLQPMKNQRDLRKFLCEKYQIVTDVKFFDGKFYDLICAKLTNVNTTLTPLQLEFGLTNLQNPSKDFVAFLKMEQQKYSQILTQCNDAEVQAKLDLVNSVVANI